MVYFLTGLFRLKKKPAIHTALDPMVSVIIAARNEEDNIGHLLEDLTKQTYKNFEIVVADDRSTDKTWEIVHKYSKKYNNVHGVKIEEKSETMTPKKNALTKAIKFSRGELILSTDADCRVPVSWISSMVKQFDPKTGVVAGYSKILNGHPSFFSNYQRVDFLALMSANAGSFGWGLPWTGSGQNIAYRKEAFNKINGFEPVADQVSGDDFYLVKAISKHYNARYANIPGSYVRTHPLNSVSAFIHQRTRWASNSQKLFKGDYFFLLFLFLNLFVNTILFAGLFFSSAWPILLNLFLVKLIFDSTVMLYGSKIFATKIKPHVYLVWWIIQPLYTPVLAMLSLLGKYRWKE